MSVYRWRGAVGVMDGVGVIKLIGVCTDQVRAIERRTAAIYMGG